MAAHHPSDWRRLAEQASKEMDSDRLVNPIAELNRVLGERDETRQQQQHQAESA